MITKIIMPKIGETMELGILIKWHKKEGDLIKKGDILFEIETDKAVFEHEAVEGGYLRKILVPAGEDLVKVLAVVGYIADSMEEPVPDHKVEAEKKVSKKKQDREEKKELSSDKGKKGSVPDSHRIFISPLAKKMAEEAGIDISAITGTGPGGRIVVRDIKSDTSVKDSAFKEDTEIKKLSRVNKITAERLTQSKATIPHYYIFEKIEMSEVIKLRSQIKKGIKDKYSSRLTYTDIILKALSLSLQKYPDFNGTYKDGVLKLSNSINIGLAVASGDELYVPVIKNIQNLTLGQIALERADLINAVADKKITPDKLSGGTFTLSNMGNTGLAGFTAIINPPELGILAAGSILKEPVVLEDKIIISDIMHVTLSCDHRIINGMYGAGFILYFKEVLESPYILLSGGY